MAGLVGREVTDDPEVSGPTSRKVGVSCTGVGRAGEGAGFFGEDWEVRVTIGHPSGDAGRTMTLF